MIVTWYENVAFFGGIPPGTLLKSQSAGASFKRVGATLDRDRDTSETVGATSKSSRANFERSGSNRYFRGQFLLFYNIFSISQSQILPPARKGQDPTSPFELGTNEIMVLTPWPKLLFLGPDLLGLWSESQKHFNFLHESSIRKVPKFWPPPLVPILTKNKGGEVKISIN